MSKPTKTGEAVHRTIEAILTGNSEEAYTLAFDLQAFYNMLENEDTTFKSFFQMDTL